MAIDGAGGVVGTEAEGLLVVEGNGRFRLRAKTASHLRRKQQPRCGVIGNGKMGAILVNGVAVGHLFWAKKWRLEIGDW